MKRIALAVIIVVGLMTLTSSFVQHQDYPDKSQGQIIHEGLQKSPSLQWGSTTPNEPISKAVIPTTTPPFTGPIPVSINMGNASDLSFIYEDGKLAYVQFYNKDYDRVVRMKNEDFQSALRTVQRQGVQGKANGLHGGITSFKDKVQNVLNGIRNSFASIVDKIKHIGASAVFIGLDMDKPVV
jgi:hypothetical protein